MFTTRTVTASDAGEHFADLVRENPDVRRLWVSKGVNGFELHVLTGPVHPEAERLLYGLGPELRQRCPTAVINILLINPVRWDAESEAVLLREALPSGASEIALGNS